MLISESDVIVAMKELAVKLKNIFLKHKEIILSVLMLLIIPSISSYILGYTYSTHSVRNIPTIIVDHDNSTLSESFVKQVNTNEVFNVTKYSQSDDDIKNLIERGNVIVGIIIPKEFSKDLIDGKAPKMMIIYDGAQMSAVSAAKTRAAEILGTIKASYLIKVGEGKTGIMPAVAKNNVIPIQSNPIFLGNPTRSTANFILQGMLIGIDQIGIIILGVLIVKEKENPISLLSKSIGFGIIGAISILFSLIIQIKYFEMPYKGSIVGGITLTILFSIVTINLGVLFKLILKDKLSAVKNSGLIISGTTLITGYTFPLMAMPDIFKKLAKFIPFLYYGGSMRDLSLLGLNFNDILPEVYDLIKYLVITWIVMLIILAIKKVLIKRNLLKYKIAKKIVKRRRKYEIAKAHR